MWIRRPARPDTPLLPSPLDGPSDARAQPVLARGIFLSTRRRLASLWAAWKATQMNDESL